MSVFEIRNLRGEIIHTYESSKSLSAENLIKFALEDAATQGKELIEPDLRGLIINNTCLDGLVIKGGSLIGAEINNSSMNGVIFEGLNAQGVLIENTSMKEANFTLTDFTLSRFKQVNAQGVELAGTILKGAVIKNSNFDKAWSLTAKTSFEGAVFFKTSMRHGQLSNTNFNKAKFYLSDLDGTQSPLSSLDQTRFIKTKLNFTNFSKSAGEFVSFDRSPIDKTILSDMTVSVIEINKIPYGLSRFKNIEENLKQESLLGPLFEPVTQNIMVEAILNKDQSKIYDLKEIHERHTNGLEKLSVRGENFNFIDLSGLDLSDIDFTGSDFKGSNLKNTNFSNSIMDAVDIHGENSSKLLDAYGANFSNTSMQGVLIKSVDCFRTSFAEAVLNYSVLTKNSGYLTNFTGAHLIACKITKSNHEDVIFKDANLTKSIIHDSTLHGNYSEANINDSTFKKSNVKGSNFTALKGVRIAFVESSLQSSNFSSSELLKCAFYKSNAKGSDFSNAEFRNTVSEYTNYKNSYFVDTGLNDCTMRKCNVDGASFENARKSGGFYLDTDFKNAINKPWEAPTTPPSLDSQKRTAKHYLDILGSMIKGRQNENVVSNKVEQDKSNTKSIELDI